MIVYLSLCLWTPVLIYSITYQMKEYQYCFVFYLIRCNNFTVIVILTKLLKCVFVGDPRFFMNVLYLNNTKHFGMRSRIEHVNLRWMKQKSTGEEYLEYTERATKTRYGVTNDCRHLPQRCLKIEVHINYEDKNICICLEFMCLKMFVDDFSLMYLCW